MAATSWTLDGVGAHSSLRSRAVISISSWPCGCGAFQEPCTHPSLWAEGGRFPGQPGAQCGVAQPAPHHWLRRGGFERWRRRERCRQIGCQCQSRAKRERACPSVTQGWLLPSRPRLAPEHAARMACNARQVERSVGRIYQDEKSQMFARREHMRTMISDHRVPHPHSLLYCDLSTSIAGVRGIEVVHLLGARAPASRPSVSPVQAAHRDSQRRTQMSLCILRGGERRGERRGGGLRRMGCTGGSRALPATRSASDMHGTSWIALGMRPMARCASV
jgi:hypothetical protein